MGWAYYEIEGRPCGYSVEARCDFPGCNTQIDRGLAYLCGDLGSHDTCENYFCCEHRTFGEINGQMFEMCEACVEQWPEAEEAYLDAEEAYREALPRTRWERLMKDDELVPDLKGAAVHLGPNE